MFSFADIPPNRCVVSSTKTGRQSAVYGPGIAVTKLDVSISTEIQKTRTDMLVEAKQFIVDGKQITSSKQIVTRVFTVREEITRGICFMYDQINNFMFLVIEENAPDDHSVYKKKFSKDEEPSNKDKLVISESDN